MLARLAACLLFAAPCLAQSLAAVRVTGGLVRPTHAGSPPGDAERLFVSEYDGRILIVENGSVRPAPFLDLGDVNALMGFAFHPKYADNGRFFITWVDLDGFCKLDEYRVSDDPNKAEPRPVRTVLAELGPDSVHSFNSPTFGMDDLLYMPTVGVFQDVAQHPSNLFGKLLRLDVDAPAPHVPVDNPYVGVPGAREEVYALGFRSPWILTCDPETGDLWVSDVGHIQSDEIDFIPFGSGAAENFGWPCIEGVFEHGGAGCASIDDASWANPLHAYDHAAGRCALIGGYVYRGAALPSYRGRYLFADHCTNQIWSLVQENGVIVDMREDTLSLEAGDAASINTVHGFARDGAGELWILDGLDGELFKIVPACGEVATYCGAASNSAGGPALIGAMGSLAIDDNDLHIEVTALPPGGWALFFFGDGQTELPIGNSQGTLCVSGNVARLGSAVVIPPAGNLRVHPNLTGLPQGHVFLAGETWNFQAFYRDWNPGPTLNTTAGLAVTFCN